MEDDDDKQKNGLAAVAEFLLFIIMIAPMSLFAGVVLSDLWRWFVSPVFHIAAITHPQAVGLNFFTAFVLSGVYLSVGRLDKEKYKPGDLIKKMIAAATLYLITWGIGALWHIFYVH